MTNSAYLCQEILKRDQIYSLQSWCWCEWDFAFQEFMQPWQCCITVIQLGTFHHTAKQLLKAKLRGRWDFCHVSFSALLCSNIEVVLSLCRIDWFVMGCGKCFPLRAEMCSVRFCLQFVLLPSGGWQALLQGCLGTAGHQRSREYEVWKIRLPVVKEQELQLSILNSLINHLFILEVIGVPVCCLVEYSLVGCVMCEPIRFFLWL